jgi:hypothetical protein
MHATVLVRHTENDRIDCALGECPASCTTHKRVVAWPTPGKLSWTVTMRDARSGNLLPAGQTIGGLEALFELLDDAGGAMSTSHFGPTVPNGIGWHWIKTVSERGWFDCGLFASPGSPCSIASGTGARIVVR